jgi:hypothetical protein
MATFFNKKEQVFEIALTDYGKTMFSLGKFDPQYYSFFDFGVLYDGLRANIKPNDLEPWPSPPAAESQNSIVPRVKNTPSLRPLAQFAGEKSNAQVKTIGLQSPGSNNITVANSKFLKPLGSSSPWSQYAPSWQINHLTGSQGFNNDEGTYQYDSTIGSPLLSSSLSTIYWITEPDMLGRRYNVLLDQQKFWVDIEEANTIFKSNGNYDIEVFKIPNDQNGQLTGTPDQLKFLNEDSKDFHALSRQLDPYTYLRTLEGTEDELTAAFPILDPTYVEYYLSLKVDSEIVDNLEPRGSHMYKGERSGLDELTDCDLNLFGVD